MDLFAKPEEMATYAEALEEERRKIEVFQRELPLCLELVTRTIRACRHSLSYHCKDDVQSDCSEWALTSDAPVLEHFIPIRASSPKGEIDEDSHQKMAKKSDWLRCASLWSSQSPDRETRPDREKGCGAFRPYKRSSTPSERGKHAPQSNRKTRRCWSPELHRRFLRALQLLGGACVATPKQILELMGVEGLTNDEVKSHLQKYRLHTRGPSSAVGSSQPVVLSGGKFIELEYQVPVTSDSTSSSPVAGVYSLSTMGKEEEGSRSPSPSVSD